MWTEPKNGGGVRKPESSPRNGPEAVGVSGRCTGRAMSPRPGRGNSREGDLGNSGDWWQILFKIPLSFGHSFTVEIFVEN